MPKAKIILVPIKPEHLRAYEGKLVARLSGLVRIQKVYAGQNMDYHFVGAEKEMVYGNLNMGFYAVVAWACHNEESDHYPVLQSRVEHVVNKFIRKYNNGHFIVEEPAKYFVPLIHVNLTENGEASDQPVY